MQSVATCFWFDGQGEQAARFYCEVFDDAAITSVLSGPDGSALVVEFTIKGQRFQALNGGPRFRLDEAASVVVLCDDQDEVDRYWTALTADGGAESRCGWCRDPFGLSWQIVPARLLELIADPDPGRAGRALQAMLQMGKLDVAALEAAAG